MSSNSYDTCDFVENNYPLSINVVKLKFSVWLQSAGIKKRSLKDLFYTSLPGAVIAAESMVKLDLKTLIFLEFFF